MTSPQQQSNGTVKTATFLHNQLQIEKASAAQLKPKPASGDALKFGQLFTDHMVEVDWSEAEGWARPRICPVHNLELHPATKIFHYAPSVFEGMKVFRGVDDQLRFFRPEKNMARMRRAAARASLPDFDPVQLLALIVELVSLDRDWVPRSTDSSLYIRPALIATDATLELSSPKRAKLFVIAGPVGSYFPTGGFQPVSVLADPSVARAFPGGVGGFKMGCNYAPTIYTVKMASEQFGCQGVLWLSGEDQKLTEVGVMNIFVFWRNATDGALELATPPTEDGLVLDGVVRDSCLELARDWAEFRVSERYPTMAELRAAVAEDRLIQMFGTGTACAVSPISKIIYKCPKSNALEEIGIPCRKDGGDLMQRLYDGITDIQYGRSKSHRQKQWTHSVPT